jgi:hypothetical protein
MNGCVRTTDVGVLLISVSWTDYIIINHILLVVYTQLYVVCCRTSIGIQHFTISHIERITVVNSAFA